MPLHDWSKMPSGLFHHFHQHWTILIGQELNRGRLPKGLSALVEQRAGAREADILTIEGRGRVPKSYGEGGASTLTEDRPKSSMTFRSENQHYAGRANRIVVRHHLGQIVAVIEVVSPGNKDSRGAIREFVDKAVEFLRAGVHLSIVDPFPPTARDPAGIHKLIWDEITDEPFKFPGGKDRLTIAYEAGADFMAFVEPVGVGDVLPNLPVFVAEGEHVPAPLESTYMAAFEACPEAMRDAVLTGKLPE
jgi:hypothetical protein